MSSGRFSARDLIIAGYLVLAGSTVLSFVNYVSAVPLGSMGWRVGAGALAAPVVDILGAVAWWFLSQLAPAEESQRHLVARAFQALAVMSAVTALSIVVTSSWVGLSLDSAPLWGRLLGYVLVAPGFFLTSQGLGRADSSDGAAR